MTTPMLIAALLWTTSVLPVAGTLGEHREDVKTTAPPGVAAMFTPPQEIEIPDDEFGNTVRLGKNIFVHTRRYAGKYVGNGLDCANCHLNDGRHPDSAPLWAAYVKYPAYRKKTGRVDTYEERLQGCFRYSMNGTVPASGSRELTALVAYSYWLATGAPVGENLKGGGYPELSKPAEAPSIGRGARIYEQNCALCHGTNGEGTRAGDKYVFPPLWGADSFNWGAGMHRINTAAGFIRANMPYGKPNSLDEQQAWDVAAFVVSHERPPDPRYSGSLAETRKKHHDEMCYYGERVDGKPVGGGPRPAARKKP